MGEQAPDGAPAPPALQVEQLRFRVGGADIIAGVELEVQPGELIGLIGPNGAGKTTLLNLITGLISPTHGTIRLHGRDITRLSPARRARLGMGRTFQTSLLFGALSVFENVRLAAQAQVGGSMRCWYLPRRDDEAGKLAGEALEAVGLSPLADHLVAGLSHGDKRKLELAILVAGGAQTLLLDEPMAGVNGEDVPGLMELIDGLRGGGRTVVMVEHHMAVVLDLADRIAVLHHGEMLACGDPASVTANQVVQTAYLGDTL